MPRRIRRHQLSRAAIAEKVGITVDAVKGAIRRMDGFVARIGRGLYALAEK